MANAAAHGIFTKYHLTEAQMLRLTKQRQVDPSTVDCDGLIKKWSAATDEETLAIKQGIAEGSLLSATAAALKQKKQEWRVFNTTTLNQKLNNERRSFLDAKEKRSTSKFILQSQSLCVLDLYTTHPMISCSSVISSRRWNGTGSS